MSEQLEIPLNDGLSKYLVYLTEREQETSRGLGILGVELAILAELDSMGLLPEKRTK